MVDYNENELGMLDFSTLSKVEKLNCNNKKSFIKSYVTVLKQMVINKKSNIFNESELKNLYEVSKTYFLTIKNFRDTVLLLI